jgi:hypothetical protein
MTSEELFVPYLNGERFGKFYVDSVDRNAISGGNAADLSIYALRLTQPVDDAGLRLIY